MKKTAPKNKMYLVRKYIMATSASQAIRKDKTHPVDDVWVDDEWKKGQAAQLESAIGFHVDDPEE